MHIAEGVLEPHVLGLGFAAAGAGTALGLSRMTPEKTPRVAVMSAAFFVASLIHIPAGVSNAHLVLNGLAGVLLGWCAFPAMLIALLLQALFFGFGGMAVLGVNTMSMAVPALACYYLFAPLARSGRPSALFAGGFLAGTAAVAMACLVAALALYCSGREFLPAIAMLGAAHLPVAVAEGLVTAFTVRFLAKVRPDLLHGPGQPAEPLHTPTISHQYEGVTG